MQLQENKLKKFFFFLDNIFDFEKILYTQRPSILLHSYSHMYENVCMNMNKKAIKRRENNGSLFFGGCFCLLLTRRKETKIIYYHLSHKYVYNFYQFTLQSLFVHLTKNKKNLCARIKQKTKKTTKIKRKFMFLSSSQPASILIC